MPNGALRGRPSLPGLIPASRPGLVRIGTGTGRPNAQDVDRERETGRHALPTSPSPRRHPARRAGRSRLRGPCPSWHEAGPAGPRAGLADGVWMRLIRRLAFLCALLFLAGAGLALGSSLLTRPCAELAGSGERHGQALVLSAGASVADGLDGQSRRRVLEGVRLWKAGTVWRLVMTGDAVGGRASAARMMADLAASRGVPREDITVEPDSQSTLQNALFSRPILADGGGVVLVSSGYHLW